MKFWFPAVAVLLVALVLIPVLWVVLAHWGGAPVGSTSDLSALLATIGGVMGAIFTVGGLVIALVSVYTQLSIENRIRQSFAALQPELDERARMQIEANLAFSRALEQTNWRQAQQLANEALEKWPTLKGVRSALAERLSNDVATWFLWRKVQHWRPMSAGTFEYTGPFWGYGPSATFMGDPPPIVYESEESLPLLEAIDWLRKAIDANEDADGYLRAALALMYGAYGRYDAAIENVQRALSRSERTKGFLTNPTSVAMLAYACRDAQGMENRLRSLGERLGIELPVSRERVLQSLESFSGSPLQSPWTVEWVVMKQPNGTNHQATKAQLGMIHIMLGDATGERRGWSSWMAGRPDEVTIPDDRSPTPIADLVSALDKRFVFIHQRESALDRALRGEL